MSATSRQIVIMMQETLMINPHLTDFADAILEILGTKGRKVSLDIDPESPEADALGFLVRCGYIEQTKGDSFFDLEFNPFHSKMK
jgi:hypothetical protein